MYEILIRCLLFEKSHSHQPAEFPPKKDGKIPHRVFEKCKKLEENYFGLNYLTVFGVRQHVNESQKSKYLTFQNVGHIDFSC